MRQCALEMTHLPSRTTKSVGDDPSAFSDSDGQHDGRHMISPLLIDQKMEYLRGNFEPSSRQGNREVKTCKVDRMDNSLAIVLPSLGVDSCMVVLCKGQWQPAC